MKKYFDSVIDLSGNAVVNASIVVTGYPGDSAVSIYTTNSTSGSPVSASTVTTDSTGFFFFYAPDGHYTLRVYLSGTLYRTLTDVEIIDGGNPLNITEFGAVGDGATDNATAFAAAWAAAESGNVLFFPAGTYRTTSSLPIKSGVSLVGEPGTIIEYLKQSTGTMIDDGNTAMTIDFRGLTLRRSGDGTALAGADGSARYTVRQQNASSVFRFWGCTLDDYNWNITDGASGALISSVLDGTAYFFGCKTTCVGYGVYTNSGTIVYQGDITTSGTKCFANHGGTINATGKFTSTHTSGDTRGTVSVAAGTTYLNGDLIRTGDANAPGIYLAGGTVYANCNIDSSGHGIQMDNSAAVCAFDGNIRAVGANAIRNTNGTCRASGVFISEQNNGLVVTGGTLSAVGVVYAPYTTVGSKDALNVTGGTLNFRGVTEASGSGLLMSGGTASIDAHMKYSAVNNSGVVMSAGTLRLDGRIDTEVNGFTLSGSGTKAIEIGSLDIIISGANTARRLISYGASTNTTMRVGILKGTVPAGAAASISTDGGNAQTITAGKVVSNVAIGADITVSAWTYAGP